MYPHINLTRLLLFSQTRAILSIFFKFLHMKKTENLIQLKGNDRIFPTWPTVRLVSIGVFMWNRRSGACSMPPILLLIFQKNHDSSWEFLINHDCSTCANYCLQSQPRAYHAVVFHCLQTFVELECCFPFVCYCAVLLFMFNICIFTCSSTFARHAFRKLFESQNITQQMSEKIRAHSIP